MEYTKIKVDGLIAKCIELGLKLPVKNIIGEGVK